jgi:8-oxo-dGTP pyrophosphatase MutT (NUDIX family)
MTRASGCIFLAVDTGRIILQLRSDTGSYSNMWGFFGGKANGRERPFETLLREVKEEIGFIPNINKVYPLSRYVSKDQNFEYQSFLVTVYSEFIPKLNKESSGYCWVSFNKWPKPLHPGVKSQLNNPDLTQKIKTVYDTMSIDGPNWLDTI